MGGLFDDPSRSGRAFLGNQIWQSNEYYGVDGKKLPGLKAQFRATGADGQDGLDEPDGPPEPVAQVRVLPGALSIFSG
jgi:hypothetical protein